MTNGAPIDGSWFTAVATFAQDTPWLHAVALLYANVLGLVLFAGLLLAGWWVSRGAPDRIMARALAAPAAVVLAYLVNNLIKGFVQENRPCRSMPTVPIVEACEAPGDWSFPSNHAAIAGAVIVAVWLTHRRLGLIALVSGLLLAGARVYIGAHYPHDVLVGLVVGGAVAFAASSAAGRWGTPVVARWRVRHRTGVRAAH